MGKLKNKKAKGTSAENELLHQFWDNEWCCVRVAGSGSTQFPSPDILAGNGFRKIVMEVKVINGYKKYFSRKEIQELEFFANNFGAEAWVGIKFSENQWYFIPTSELSTTKSENYCADILLMKKQGFKFHEMIE